MKDVSERGAECAVGMCRRIAASPVSDGRGTSGLYYYNARWYDHLIGRFTSPDTIVPQPGNPGGAEAGPQRQYVHHPSAFALQASGKMLPSGCTFTMQDTTTPRWAGSRSRIRLCRSRATPAA